MRSLFVMLTLSVAAFFFSTDANASYRVAGSAEITGAGANWVSWKCPPPNITCFSHGGSGTSPAPGQHVILHVGPNQYDMTLMSAEEDQYIGEFEEGTPPELIEEAD